MKPTDEQRRQLEVIGRNGKTMEQIRVRFGRDLDETLITNRWVWVHRLELEETLSPGDPPSPPIISYHLTPRGAELAGIDPETLP
jgi:hypothetical protein